MFTVESLHFLSERKATLYLKSEYLLTQRLFKYAREREREGDKQQTRWDLQEINFNKLHVYIGSEIRARVNLERRL